jgi:head-tail adaptor
MAALHRAGRYTRYVTLSRSPQTSGDADGFFEDLSPRDAWCQISPQGSLSDTRTATHSVEMPYHSQVSIDTRILYNGRELFVRSVQNVDEQNTILRLVCEEIL